MVSTAPLRYEDGKRLKGIGTRASKSRLTSVQRRRTLLECLSTCRKEDKKGSLASLVKEGEWRERMNYASRLVFPIKEGRRGLRGNWRARREDKW